MTEDEEWDKAVGQYQMIVANMVKPLRLYGNDAYVTSMLPELVSASIQLHLKLSGVDIPYHVNFDKLHW